ncbi:MAG: hypothetical protein LC117_00165 [Bacteroidia bacterium]|nr:hypothetical protein [Bacteroidia bacterium]
MTRDNLQPGNKNLPRKLLLKDEDTALPGSIFKLHKNSSDSATATGM